MTPVASRVSWETTLDGPLLVDEVFGDEKLMSRRVVLSSLAVAGLSYLLPLVPNRRSQRMTLGEPLLRRLLGMRS